MHEPTATTPALRLAQLVRGLPDFPGRDTIVSTLLRRVLSRDVEFRGEFGWGLRYAGNPRVDPNVEEMLQLRYASPALAPVLDALLEPGGVLADVGANLGLYTLWGARRVGASGSVHAFEPVPDVAACLRRNVELNGFHNVQIVESAVGAEPGVVTLKRPPGGSGRTSRYVEGKSIDAPVVTLDAYFEGRRKPDLVKIDVEGMEFEVLMGARALLAGADAPALVFEAQSDLFAAAGTSYARLLALLADTAGYRVFALTPRGLRHEPAGAQDAGSLNVLALRPDLAAHERGAHRLTHRRFASNQNA